MGFFDKTNARVNEINANAHVDMPKGALASLSSLPQLSTPLNLSLGINLFPHQEVPVKAVRDGHRSLLIGDEMGVGKTATAIAIVEDQRAYPSAFVVPPSLTHNWRREWERAVPGRSVSILSGMKPHAIPQTDVVIIPDNLAWPWAMKPAPNKKGYLPTGPLGQHRFAALVVDECHRLKNEESKRTRAVLALSRCLPPDGLRLLMSGTPLINRPLELVAPLSILDKLRGLFGTSYQFKYRYCAPVYNGFGMDFKGASNVEELNQILRANVMIRRKREDVLSLPNKGRNLLQVPLSDQSLRDYKHAQENLQDFLRRVRDDEDYHISWRAEAIVLLGTLRKVSGQGKVSAVVEATLDLLDEGEQVFIAAWHKDVVSSIWAALRAKKISTVTVVGDDSVTDKQAAVDRFQSGDARVLIGNILSAGVGFTLTAARHVLIAELPWTPSDLMQVEDRLHRIGQTREVISTVFVSDVENGSVDQRLWGMLDGKAQVVGAVLDGDDTGLSINESMTQNALLDSYR